MKQVSFFNPNMVVAKLTQSTSLNFAILLKGSNSNDQTSKQWKQNVGNLILRIITYYQLSDSRQQKFVCAI